MTAFQATYSDWKLIRTRKVVQIVLEVPVEQADQAYKVLGGMPLSGEETWVGVARLKQESEVMPNSARDATHDKTEPASADPSPKPVRAPIAPEKRMTQRAAILCNDRLFQTWLRQTNGGWKLMNLGSPEEKAAEIVRAWCGVKSRKEIIPGTEAARLFDAMLGEYAAWQACLEDVAS